MLIYDALHRDHDNVKELLEMLTDCRPGDEAFARNTVQKIRDELIPHSKAEESVFYNSLKSIPGTDEIVLHGYEEHMEAESTLSKLMDVKTIDDDWMKNARKLQQAVEHHIHEEETRIFNVARQLLTQDEAEMMSDAFQELKPQVREGSVVQTSLDMIAKMMPTRFAATLRTATLQPR